MDFAHLFLPAPAWLTDTALLLGRLALGPCFVLHALGKLGVVGNGSMQGFAAWLADLGVPLPKQQAWAAMLSELVGGVLLTLGLATRPVSVVLMCTMLVAAFVGHRGAGYLITNDPPGKEYALNLAVVSLMFALLGPGAYALDAWLVARL